MSNEILLKTLGDALRRIARKKEEAEERVKAYQDVQQRKEERLQNAEQRKQQAEAHHERVTHEMDVLRTFMSSQEEQSHALIEQFDLLQKQQLHIMSEVQLATDHAHHSRAEYQHVLWQLSGAEQDKRAAQCEWDEIAEKITHISSNSLR